VKRIASALLALAAALALAGCISVATPAIGLLYTDVDGPVDAGDTVGTKEGRACAQTLLGLIATGDASIKAAAAAGGITKIASVDHHSRNVLGILGEFCTIVRGS
jgi:hypothetical protein